MADYLYIKNKNGAILNKIYLYNTPFGRRHLKIGNRYLNFDTTKYSSPTINLKDKNSGQVFYPIDQKETVFKFFDMCFQMRKCVFEDGRYIDERNNKAYSKEYVKPGYYRNEHSYTCATDTGDGSHRWNTIHPSTPFRLAKNLKVFTELNCDVGNADWAGVWVTVVSKKNGVSIEKYMHYDEGSNWSGKSWKNCSFSSSEIDKLGGPGTEVYFKIHIYEDRGSTKYIFRCTVHFDAKTWF